MSIKFFFKNKKYTYRPWKKCKKNSKKTLAQPQFLVPGLKVFFRVKIADQPLIDHWLTIDRPSTNHRPTIDWPSTNHQLTIDQPSTDHQPTFDQPSTNHHQPTINWLLTDHRLTSNYWLNWRRQDYEPVVPCFTCSCK